MNRALLGLALLLLAPSAEAGRRKAETSISVQEGASRLLGMALHSDEAWQELVDLSDGIGNRLAGSPALDRAIAWGAAELEADGLTVRLDPVSVPAWRRGEESVVLLDPIERPLTALTLGNSVGTDGPLEAEVMVVSSFEELEARSAEAAGRIVLYDVPFTDYGETVQYRWDGANQAQPHGAVGVMVRSVAPAGHDTPHTGAMGYDEGVTPIPAVAVTHEGAALLHRLAADGSYPRVRLELGAHFDEEALSHNVVGSLRGRELPDEIVVLGCHLDSWDVGQGAQDDGAGCVMVMEAARLLATLPNRPRRTVQVVLFTNEENGLRGGRALAADHPDTRWYAALEADTGAGTPLGFRIDVRDGEGGPDEGAAREAAGRLAPWGHLFAPLGAGRLELSWSGADIGPVVAKGALGVGLMNDMSGYWPIHHTTADTVDKIDPMVLRQNVAAVAIMAWLLAETDPKP